MIRVVFEKENLRSACYDDDIFIGECTCYEKDGVWYAYHTFVDSEYKGMGLAKKLLRVLADAAIEADVKIKPVCSFVVKQFEENKEYEAIKA